MDSQILLNDDRQDHLVATEADIEEEEQEQEQDLDVSSSSSVSSRCSTGSKRSADMAGITGNSDSDTSKRLRRSERLAKRRSRES